MTNTEKNESKYFDPFTRMLGLEVEEVWEDGLTARSKLKPDFCNTYSSAHGGYVYALGYTAAVLSAELCLGRRAVAVDVSNLYECSLMGAGARIGTKLVEAGREAMVYRVQVVNSADKLCLSQLVTLKDTDQPKAGLREFRQTIFAGDENSPIDPVTGTFYPCLSVFFAAVCHIHVLGRGEKGMIYGADICPDTCDGYGAAHSGLIYTCCDCAAGGSAALLLEKKPVTVSSSIHYLRSAMAGPVKAEARLIRAGKQLLFYDVDVTDGNGELIAVSHFVMKCVEYKIRSDMKLEYRRKAFKD